MCLPGHVTTTEVQELRVILQHFESSLRTCNPYARDFQLACELPREQVEQSRLITHIAQQMKVSMQAATTVLQASKKFASTCQATLLRLNLETLLYVFEMVMVLCSS